MNIKDVVTIVVICGGTFLLIFGSIVYFTSKERVRREELELEHNQHLVECVEKTQDTQWCLNTVKREN